MKAFTKDSAGPPGTQEARGGVSGWWWDAKTRAAARVRQAQFGGVTIGDTTGWERVSPIPRQVLCECDCENVTVGLPAVLDTMILLGNKLD